MQGSPKVEIWVGLFVLAGILAALMLAFKVSNLSGYQAKASYEVTARFGNVGGLKVKAPVTIGGVRIGRVTGIEYDQEAYEAVVSLDINEDFNRIPNDSTASILTAGLLGEQYIGFDPGGADEYLQGGDEVELTQSALVLEKIIGQFLFKDAAE